MGTLGVLALAKYLGIILEVRPLVERLTEEGFWISEGIIENFLMELEEF